MPKPPKTKQLAIDTILFGISTFGSKILVFLLTPLYTTVLLTEEYGIADLINTTVNLIHPLLTLAISEATLRYALDKNCSKHVVLNTSLVVCTLSSIVLMGSYPFVTMVQSEITLQLSRYWGYFVATFVLYNLHLCFANFVKGIGNTKLFAIQGIVQTITVILCNIYFLLIRKAGLQGYLLSIIGGFFVPTVLLFFSGGIYKYLYPFRLDRKLFSEMLKYSIPMIPTLLAWSINMYINKYMLIALLPAGEGVHASGIISVANKIPSLLTAVLSIFTHAWQLSAIANVNDADESSYYTIMYRALHIVSLIGCLIIIPLSKLASSLLFHERYYTAWQHIPFLTLSAFFSCLCGFLASAFRAYKKTGQLFTSVAIGAITNSLLSLILIHHWGILGASIATAASFFVTWAFRMYCIQKLVNVKIPLLHTVVTYALTALICITVSIDSPYHSIAYILSCIVILVINFTDLKNVCVWMISMINYLLEYTRKWIRRN